MRRPTEGQQTHGGTREREKLWQGDPDDRNTEVVDFAVLETRRAGPPLPPFTTIADEADAWAAIANSMELKKYVAAAVNRFSSDDLAGLAAYISKRLVP